MKKPVILMIHGFGGGIEEIELLHMCLEQAGFLCRSFVLPGHKNKGKIKGAKAADFIAAALQEYDLLATPEQTVALVGFSMGGLLGLQLAVLRTPAALVMINTPVYIGNAASVLHWLGDDWKHGRKYHWHRITSSMTKQNLKANWAFWRLRQATLPLAAEVHLPVFIGQSIYDETVDRKSAAWWDRHLVTDTKQLHYYRRSWHKICDSEDLPLLCRDITAFLNGLWQDINQQMEP